MKLVIDIPYYIYEQVKRENTIKNVLNRIDFAVRNGVERSHGEWKPIGEPDDLGIHSWHICSSCGFRTTWHMVDIFHFCPNCGASMGKEGDEK